MAAIIEEFKKSLTRCTENTKNVRAFNGKWFSAVYKVPEEIRVKISCIVSLLQENISEFCEKDEYLMIYNFQPLSDTPTFYSLDMVIKPVSKITDLNVCDGQPLQLMIDGEGNIVNNSFALKALELLDEEEEQTEPPLCYGNYHNYPESTPNLIATLMGLKLSFADTALSSETKGKKESDSNPASEYQAEVSSTITFTFNTSAFADSTLSEMASSSSLSSSPSSLSSPFPSPLRATEGLSQRSKNGGNTFFKSVSTYVQPRESGPVL